MHMHTHSVGKNAKNKCPLAAFDNISISLNMTESTEERSSNPQLKEHLEDEVNYVLMPAEAWNKLEAWYTLRPGQDCGRLHAGCCY